MKKLSQKCAETKNGLYIFGDKEVTSIFSTENIGPESQNAKGGSKGPAKYWL